MEILEWIRFIVGTILLILGIGTFFVEIFGVYHFKYVLNRMHSAAMGDTLGLAVSILGLIVINGFNFVSLKLFCVIAFLWLASPVASHLIAQLEVTVNPKTKEFTEIDLNSVNTTDKEEAVNTEEESGKEIQHD